MKRLSFERKQRIIRLSAASRRRRNRINRCARRRKKRLPRAKSKLLRIVAPTSFSLVLEENQRKMLGFVSQVENAVRARQRVAIDFSKTNELHPCGTLLFMSRVESLIDSLPGSVTCNYPDDEVVEQLFQHIGLLRRLGLTARSAITSERVKHWHYLQGSCADTSDLKELLTAYEQALSMDVRSHLYASLSEAITNVINHAYPTLAKVGADKHWWMFSQSNDGKLFIGICDKGIGIPDSLRKKPHLKDHVRRMRVVRKHRMDEFLLADAAGSPRTVTQMAHRGKGLPEMLQFVKSLGAGALTIFSQHGVFNFQGSLGAPLTRTYQLPISGTLIFWEIPLEGSHHEDDNFDSE